MWALQSMARGGWSHVIKHQQVSDVTKVLIVQLKMACDIDTYGRAQVCKSCDQDTELHELVTVQARWQA